MPRSARRLVAGAAQSTVKQLVLFPFDTLKCRLQLAGTRRSLFDGALYADLYSGIAPAVVRSRGGALC